MEISEDENIEIFNKTQRFCINKYENQIIRMVEEEAELKKGSLNLSVFSLYQ